MSAPALLTVNKGCVSLNVLILTTVDKKKYFSSKVMLIYYLVMSTLETLFADKSVYMSILPQTSVVLRRGNNANTSSEYVSRH